MQKSGYVPITLKLQFSYTAGGSLENILMINLLPEQ